MWGGEGGRFGDYLRLVIILNISVKREGGGGDYSREAINGWTAIIQQPGLNY